ncbi:MBL fold metallo-hydrolase [Bacillus sp. JJ1773]|uniref:MBL fold metallo-hydrolase n=1 Tax=Bacillus sp. JJ1773 TaxID=3122965 RepID=UPI002FFEA8AF
MIQEKKEEVMRLWLLGTGTPDPSLNRASSGYLIQIDDDYIIFDHGFGAYHRLLQLGVPITKITHVFLSHYHFDHIGDLPRLLLTHWDQGAGKVDDLNIYGPQPLQQIIDGCISMDGLFGPDLVARTNAKSSLQVYASRGGDGTRAKPNPKLQQLEKGDIVSEENWTVKVTEGYHQQPYLTPLAFRLEHGGKSIVYSGDSGPKGGLEKFAQSCDVLIHMCHYINGMMDKDEDVMGHIELAQLANNANVKSLVLTHMNEALFDQPGIKEKVLQEMGEIYKGKIYYGEDLMEIPVI